MKMKSKKAKIPIKHKLEAQPVPIISDAVVATVGVGEGRLIPMVILDSSARPDIEELVRVHEHLPPGDVTVQWAQSKSSPDRIMLILRFTRPTEVLFMLEFDIVRQGMLVDQALSSRALYLQPGYVGDRVSETLDANRILIEVPDTGFRRIWDYIHFKHLVKEFRRRGLSRHQAKADAKAVIEEYRKFARSRPMALKERGTPIRN